MQTPIELNFPMRTCVAGEEWTDDNRCQKCKATTYLYDVPTEVTSCKDCDPNADCYGGTVVAPNKEYWRSTNISEEFYACLNPAACMGGSETEPTGVCDTGYEGVLCAECKTGFTINNKYECTACPDFTLNVI